MKYNKYQVIFFPFHLAFPIVYAIFTTIYTTSTVAVISKATIITTVAIVEIIMKTTVEAKLQNLLPGKALSDWN